MNLTPKLLDQCQKLYSTGASDAEICKELGVSKKEFQKEIDTNPVFSRFVDLGRTLSEAWWYLQSRINLGNKEFKDSLWNTNMKARFGVGDKQEITVNQTSTEMNEVMKSLAPLLAKVPVLSAVKKVDAA